MALLTNNQIHHQIATLTRCIEALENDQPLLVHETVQGQKRRIETIPYRALLMKRNVLKANILTGRL